MATENETVSPDTTVEYLVELLGKENVSGVPVLERHAEPLRVE